MQNFQSLASLLGGQRQKNGGFHSLERNQTREKRQEFIWSGTGFGLALNLKHIKLKGIIKTKMYLQEKIKAGWEIRACFGRPNSHLTVRSPKGWEENFIRWGFLLILKLFHTVFNVYLYSISLSSVTVSQVPLMLRNRTYSSFCFHSTLDTSKIRKWKTSVYSAIMSFCNAKPFTINR